MPATHVHLRARGPHPLAAPPCLAKARAQEPHLALAAERGVQRNSRSSEWSMNDGAREDHVKMKRPARNGQHTSQAADGGGGQDDTRGYSGVIRQMGYSANSPVGRPVHVACCATRVCLPSECCGWATLQEYIVHLGYVLLEDRVSGGPSATRKFTRKRITRRLPCLTPPRWEHSE